MCGKRLVFPRSYKCCVCAVFQMWSLDSRQEILEWYCTAVAYCCGAGGGPITFTARRIWKIISWRNLKGLACTLISRVRDLGCNPRVYLLSQWKAAGAAALAAGESWVLPCDPIPRASFPRGILKTIRETPVNSSLSYLFSFFCEVRYMEQAWWVARKKNMVWEQQKDKELLESQCSTCFFAPGCVCRAVTACTSMLLRGRLSVFSAQPISGVWKEAWNSLAVYSSCCSFWRSIFNHIYCCLPNYTLL